jgi:hypothetical protein
MIAGINLQSTGIRRRKVFISHKIGRNEEDVQGVEEYTCIPLTN